jgi:hypothetical protein
MLFDVITTLILFGVLSRLTRRRGDVLYYVSSTDTPWRSSFEQSASPRRIGRSTRPARKRLSFAGTR